ncbi:MAG: ribonuclease HII [Desulfarculaceae bacterium]|nr:ribonuclease HII [Desulfarculaceae bacterium]
MRDFENQAGKNGYRWAAGIDEAGRGPLAGPVVSASVILPAGFADPAVIDSKKITPACREKLYQRILDNALYVAVGAAHPEEIDRVNILRASLNSMKRACENLEQRPDYLLIDGKFGIDLDIAQVSLVKGESRSISIAAASIVAKVTRDRMMMEFHKQYPAYGFDRHKGYPTRKHKESILMNGPCPIHRKTFKGVREVPDAE